MLRDGQSGTKFAVRGPGQPALHGPISEITPALQGGRCFMALWSWWESLCADVLSPEQGGGGWSPAGRGLHQNVGRSSV